MIEGVALKRLKVIPDERGRLMECLRSDDDLFIAFGQMYVTTSNCDGRGTCGGQKDKVLRVTR